MKNSIRIFCDKFVNKNLQSRIVHEWEKKPEKLYERICHQADTLFDEKFKKSSIDFDENEKCYLFQGGKAELVRFQHANSFLGNGEGVLIVSENGQKFIAETEFQKGFPSEIFSGS